MKSIPGYEGLYAATEDGRVWSYPKSWTASNGSKRSHNGKFIKPFLVGSKNNQYLSVELSGKTAKVHRLIASTFIPNPANLPVINHIDGNKLNNAADNLEWLTQKQNMIHAQANGLNKQFYGESHGRHKLSTAQVENIRHLKKSGLTLKELSGLYSTSISNVSYITRMETRING